MRLPFLHSLAAFFCLIPLAAQGATLPEDTRKAVILAYHRVGEDAYPNENIRLEQFREQMEELTSGGYAILPLPDLLAALETGETLPPRAVAITFEGAYKSASLNALPLLIEKNIPFTVFFASDNADHNHADYMNWDDLKAISTNENVTLGTLPASYAHIAQMPEQEALSNLNRARARYREHFNREADYLALPFGEYTPRLLDLTRQQGFKAAFGLQSGAAYPASNLYNLPRFSITEEYADLDRFRQITDTLPLPVLDLEPQSTLLENNATQIAVGFTLPPLLQNRAKDVSCFTSAQGKPDLEIIGSRIELRQTIEDHDTQTHLNCIITENKSGENSTETQQWRWLGLLLHKRLNPQPDEPPAPLE